MAVAKVRRAARLGNTQELETVLVKHPYLVDDIDEFGYGAMHIAASHGHASIVEVLVRFGSRQIDTLTAVYETPLMIAAYERHALVVETLVRFGSRAIDTPNIYGMTPMYIVACMGDNIQMVETLVRSGSKAMDTPDCDGLTPVYKALQLDRKDCFTTLKLLGADCSCIPLDAVPEKKMHLLNSPIDEDESAEIRHRVYFRQPLLERLFVELDRRLFTREQRSI